MCPTVTFASGSTKFPSRFMINAPRPGTEFRRELERHFMFRGTSQRSIYTRKSTHPSRASADIHAHFSPLHLFEILFARQPRVWNALLNLTKKMARFEISFFLREYPRFVPRRNTGKIFETGLRLTHVCKNTNEILRSAAMLLGLAGRREFLGISLICEMSWNSATWSYHTCPISDRLVAKARVGRSRTRKLSAVRISECRRRCQSFI